MSYCRRLARLDEQIVWTDKCSGICPSDVNLCRTVVDFKCSSRRANHLAKLVFPDGQISVDLFVEKFVPPVCTLDDLFV